MFTGFTDETVQFFLDLKFHNNTPYFHENHDRYVETVQTPFYEMITDLGDEMRKIDPLMEIRPYKCLSRIHRDTLFPEIKALTGIISGFCSEEQESQEIRACFTTLNSVRTD